MAGLTGCAITGLVVVGWPIIGPGCTELPGIHPENLNFDRISLASTREGPEDVTFFFSQGHSRRRKDA